MLLKKTVENYVKRLYNSNIAIKKNHGSEFNWKKIL